MTPMLLFRFNARFSNIFTRISRPRTVPEVVSGWDSLACEGIGRKGKEKGKKTPVENWKFSNFCPLNMKDFAKEIIRFKRFVLFFSSFIFFSFVFFLRIVSFLVCGFFSSLFQGEIHPFSLDDEHAAG